MVSIHRFTSRNDSNPLSLQFNFNCAMILGIGLQ